MNPPSLSVVIPAYNVFRTIEAAVRSVLDQTYAPTEIIVVDDGSSDATCDVVRAIKPSVKLLRQTNGGPGQARNTGARAAVGDWLAFLDADDVWLPEKLERQIPFTKDARVAVVNCRAKTKSGEPLGDSISLDALWLRNDLITSSCLVRSSAFKEVGGFAPQRYCEDYHLWLRLASRGWIISNCAEDLVVYSRAPGGLSRQTDRFAAAEIACIKEMAPKLAVSGARLKERLIAAYLGHARGAIHDRNLNLARMFVRESLSLGISGEQLWMLAIASVPAPLLDLRRRWKGD